MASVSAKQSSLPSISHPPSATTIFLLLSTHSFSKNCVNPHSFLLPPFPSPCKDRSLTPTEVDSATDYPLSSVLISFHLLAAPAQVMRLSLSACFPPLGFRTHHTVLLFSYLSGYTFSFSFTGYLLSNLYLWESLGNRRSGSLLFSLTFSPT